jgi:hypothetical protein
MHQKIRLERTINFELVKVLTIKPLTKQTRELKNTLRKPKQIESHNHESKNSTESLHKFDSANKLQTYHWSINSMGLNHHIWKMR